MAGFADVEFWTAADGARLALRREAARGERRAALVLVHGFGDHSGRYAHVADWLAGRGIAVFALDQRGHGRSPGPRGHVARFAQYLSDIVALRRLVAAETPGPQLLLGHSFGGLVVLRFLETAPAGLAGAAVTSPLVDVSMPVPRWKMLLGRALADLAPALPFRMGVEYGHLSTDPAIEAQVENDPLHHDVMSPRAYFESLQARRALCAESGRIAVPVFFGLAGDDRIASLPAARAFALGLVADVTLKVYDGFYHEVLHERDRARVLDDLGLWMDRVLEAPAERPVRSA